MNDLDKKLREALQNVNDSYPDFVTAYAGEFKGHPEKEKALLDYLEKNPDARTDQIINEILDRIWPELLESDDDEDDEDDEDEDEDK